MRLAYLFPGQGSQYVGMGQAIHNDKAFVREIFDLAGEISGQDVARLCFEGPLEELTRTRNLQVALMAVDLAYFRVLQELGLRPVALAGHSLGEYGALCAAGVLSINDAFRLVRLRAELMERASQARPGAMSALIGLSADEVSQLCREAGGLVVVANHNSPEQVVVSGEAEAVGRVSQLARERKARAVPLKVSGAWHSPLMEAAAADFARALGEAEFKPPEVPVIFNVTGEPEDDPTAIGRLMARQLNSPVLWAKSLEGLAARGAEGFVEVGPKRVLLGLVKKTLGEAPVFSAEDPKDLQNLLNEIK